MPGKPRGRGESNTSARRLGAAEKRKRALQLKIAGATYQQIADTPVDQRDPNGPKLYTSRQRAYDAVNTELENLKKDNRGGAEQLRALELARLDQMQVALWPSTRPTKAVHCEETCACGMTCRGVMWREPDQGAVDRVLKIQERRGKYVKVETSAINDDRELQILEQQVALAHEAMVGAMERAGISAEQQQEVLQYAAEIFRDNDPDEDEA